MVNIFIRDNVINYTEREKQIVRIAGIFINYVKSHKYLCEYPSCSFGYNGYIENNDELEISWFNTHIEIKDKSGEEIKDKRADGWTFNINVTLYSDLVVSINGADFNEDCILDHECNEYSCYYDYIDNPIRCDELCEIIFMPIAGVYNFSQMEDQQIREHIEIMFNKFFRKIGHEELESYDLDFSDMYLE